MNSENTKPRSLAAKASWVSLALITGCVCAFVVFAMIDEAVGGFAQNRPGQFRNPCLRASVCIDLIASTLCPALCVDLPYTTHWLALQEPRSVDPQEFTQSRGVATIGLVILPFLRLDEDHVVATVVVEHPDQPIVESADFESSDERLALA